MKMRLVSVIRTTVSIVVVFLLCEAYGGGLIQDLEAKLITSFNVNYVRNGVEVKRAFQFKKTLKASKDCAVLRVVELDESSKPTTNEFVFKIALSADKYGLLAVQNDWDAMQYLTWKANGMKESDFTTVIPERVHPVLTEVYFCEWMQIFKTSGKSLVVCMESLEENFQCILNKKEHKPDTFIRWEISMLDIVKFYRDNELVHRDLKPDNFVLDKDGNIHVIDYGYTHFPKTKYLPVIRCGNLLYMSINTHENGSNPIPLDDGFAIAYICLQLRVGLTWEALKYPENAEKDFEKLRFLAIAERGGRFVNAVEMNELRLRIHKHDEELQLEVMSRKKKYAEELIKKHGCTGAQYEIIVKSLYNNILTVTNNIPNYENCITDFNIYCNKPIEKADPKGSQTLGDKVMSFFSKTVK